MSMQQGYLITLCLTGNVMSRHGINQILSHLCLPRIHETAMDSALGYVHLTEEVNGPLPRVVDPTYIWGDTLARAILERLRPDLGISYLA
ncbi:MAG: hypothetical protein P3W87_004660 [Gammaproteobacteria bacterium]|nr:hypothetical protein [Gammaproteobacteria bacterium]